MEKPKRSVLGESGMSWHPQADHIHHMNEFTHYELHPDPIRKLELEHRAAENVIFDIMLHSTKEKMEDLAIKHLTEER